MFVFKQKKVISRKLFSEPQNIRNLKSVRWLNEQNVENFEL